MAFRSGRTEEQGLRPFVIEGDKLYVPPARFSRAQSAAVDPCHSDGRAASIAVLRALGFIDAEIQEFEDLRHPGLSVVVDPDLRP